jgi:hypothetical protein
MLRAGRLADYGDTGAEYVRLRISKVLRIARAPR